MIFERLGLARPT
ncbi:hypothetical protein CGLO_14241 [Colletotrichum gloeosporioides Cg-14]|uniref:Uncharacterized protein n=1 Tax=Colletotrichum gloeosporioides (strain Cg-14) TaxID=1237896 RepID=T0JUP8_COLGC|nr:hypothetical protein CGLO_14241 [Colletotrichum gloeosporioides Cg-14]